MRVFILVLISIFSLGNICSAQKVVNYNVEFCDLQPGDITMKQLGEGTQMLKIKHPAGAEGKISGFDMIVTNKKENRSLFETSNKNTTSSTMKMALLYARSGDSFIITNIRVDFGRGEKVLNGYYTYNIK